MTAAMNAYDPVQVVVSSPLPNRAVDAASGRLLPSALRQTIAEACLKAKTSPYNSVYYDRKQATDGRVHTVPCAQCGGAGKAKEAVGQPWKPGHRHADALRYVAKRILRDLWREAKRIHETPAEEKREAPLRAAVRSGGNLAGLTTEELQSRLSHHEELAKKPTKKAAQWHGKKADAIRAELKSREAAAA